MGRTLQSTGASVILYKDKQVLLQLRRDNHCWGYAGGRIEMGEMVEDAARREVFEETGLHVGKMRLFGVFSGPDLRNVYPDGNETHIIDIVFTSEDFEGALKPQPEEVIELKWFDMAEVPENLSPPNRRALLQFIALQLDA